MGGFDADAYVVRDLGELMRYRERAQRLLASGVESAAVITSVSAGQALAGGSVMTEFGVTIAPADSEPYPATIRQAMNVAALEDLQAGEAITVRYDPADRTSAMITGW
ncbi:MAG: hypothetical protein ACRDOB_04820 [Streptosporangiaceae bacterium]